MPEPIKIQGGTFEEETHIYRDESGKRVPSVTQILSLLGLVDYSHIREEILERKSAIGVAVHSAVQFLCEGALDWDTVGEEVMPYVVGAERWLREQEFTSESQEGQGIAVINGASYGFMYDHLGSMMFKGRRRRVIMDLKTCVAASPTWRLQTAAYALAAPKLPAGERYLRCILQLKKDGSFRPHYYEDREDESAWQYFLYCAIWALNHDLKGFGQ